MGSQSILEVESVRWGKTLISVVNRTLLGNRSCVLLVVRIKQIFNDQEVKYKNGKHSGNDFFFLKLEWLQEFRASSY